MPTKPQPDAHSGGRLVVIDGTDGSGKNTQTMLLAQRLREENVPVETISFPQYDVSFFGALAGRYLRGEFGAASDVSPYLASVLFAMDRWESRDKLRDWLVRGKVVVADRYVSANAGHQAIKIDDPMARAEFVDWVEQMEHTVLGLPRPDLVVFLHMPWQIAQELVGHKGDRAYLQGARRDIHEADPEHLRRAEQAYVDMARGHSEWRTIECAHHGDPRTMEAIAEDVWREVKTLLGR